jgi:hypothetical protein
MYPAPTSETHPDARAPKPRAYVLPVVRPVPPRPAGGTVRTW